MNTAFTWNQSPEIVSLGPIIVRWYGLLFALGFYIGLQIIRWMFARDHVKFRTLDNLLFYLMVGTIVGARLGHTLIYEPEIYLADPLRILKIWEGGLASHGGALGVIMGTYLWKRKNYPGSFISLVDYLSIPTALVCGMIRIGNLFNSEILGRPAQVPWAVIFQRVDNVPRHPAMIYECLACMTTFVILFSLFKKGIHRNRQGLLLGVFFVFLFSMRFLIEFLKEYQVASEASLPIDLGQMLSIPFILFGIYLIYNAYRKGTVLTKKSR